jgi:hypothetical protein
MQEYYVKVYKRKKKKDTYAANIVKRSSKRGKAVKVARIKL